MEFSKLNLNGQEYTVKDEKAREDIKQINEDIKTVFADVSNGTPLVATTTSEMVDTSRIYVNTTDGHWYYYANSTWNDGGVYQGTELNENDDKRITRLESEYLDKIFIPTIQGCIDLSGVVHDISGSTNTDYINIEDFDVIEYQTYLDPNHNEIAYYDSNKDYISGVVGDYKTTLKRVTPPDNAKYVIFSYYNNSGVSNPYIKISKTNSTVNELKNIGKELYKYVDPNKIIPSIIGGIDLSGGFYDVSYVSRTDFIDISSKDIIEYQTYLNDTQNEIAFYDSNKNYISGIAGNDKTTLKRVTPPENAKFVILAWYNGSDFTNPYIKITKNNSVEIQIDKKVNPLRDKNILIFGDSITDCCSITVDQNTMKTTSYRWSETQYPMWPKILNDVCKCKEIRNYALSGASYTTRAGVELRQSLIDQITIALNDINNPNNVFSQDNFNPDIIVFALGTNDTRNDTYESAIAKTVYEDDNESINVNATLENLDTTKFNEAIRYAYLKVKNQFPMAQIYVVTPIQRASNDMLEDNRHLDIQKMGKRYGCIIIEGNSDTGIIRDLEVKNSSGVYLKDGLHPNGNGQKLMARAIIKSMQTHYMDL